MKAKRFLIPFVLASLAGHALLLALTTRLEWTDIPFRDKAIKVDLEAPTQETASQPAPATPAAGPPARSAGGGVVREDSVALQNPGGPYDAYLLPIRRKIERLWRYPPEALARGQEGVALIRFTIDANGTLSGYHVVTTSGSVLLDEGALAVVRAAAPYDPIPANLRLSRLHVTAAFEYRMDR
ncbi:MAG: energy transducer TonB [Deltaproteobacteria bacterium]|nr:energy transducer TonB [Deltaproteobacteria bacterium]